MKRVWKPVIVVVVVLLTVLVATQPRKSLEVAILWTPPYPDFMKELPEYQPNADGKDHIVYRVYYAWNGKRDGLPWWIITDSLDGHWRVIEAANGDDYSTHSSENVLFNKNWAQGGFRRVARTRFEKIRHALLGTDDFSRERKTLDKVLNLIEKQEQYEAQGKDLFDSIRAHIDKNPGVAEFFPPERTYWNEKFKQMEEHYRTQKQDIGGSQEHSESPESGDSTFNPGLK